MFNKRFISKYCRKLFMDQIDSSVRKLKVIKKKKRFQRNERQSNFWGFLIVFSSSFSVYLQGMSKTSMHASVCFLYYFMKFKEVNGNVNRRGREGNKSRNEKI